MDIIRKMTGYRSRWNYWSNSAFSKWVQKLSGMEKSPTGATAKEWRLLEERQKKVNKVVYWITEELFDCVQNFLMFPYDVYRNVSHKLHNFFITKTHYLNTRLPKGEWHESETRLLHGMMELVVDFVEGEEAHMYDMSAEYADSPSPKIKGRREAGLAHLDWAISLTMDEDYPGIEKDDPDYGKPTSQSVAASEIKEIYLWWKDVYPNRVDPMETSGWSEYCASKPHMFENEDETPEEKQRVRDILDTNRRLEQEQDDEDTEMLIRVVKARKNMWS